MPGLQVLRVDRLQIDVDLGHQVEMLCPHNLTLE